MAAPDRWQQEENKKLNRILLISGAVLVILLLLLLFMAKAEVGKMKRIEAPADCEAVMERLYGEDDYSRLYSYMEEYQLFDEAYYDYSQAALLSHAMELCRIYMWSFEDARTKDGSQAVAEEYLENALVYSHGILNSAYFGFPEFEGKNEMLLNEYKEEVRAGLKVILHLTDEEISRMESEASWKKEELDMWLKEVGTRGLSDE